jgi:hypothetical protein
MSQQEFYQEPEKRSRRIRERGAYYRRSGEVPKEEHPSTFDDVVEDAAPPYAYRAQDDRRSSSQARLHERLAAGPPPEQRYGPWYRQRSRLYQRTTNSSPWQNPLVRWAVIILGIFVLLHILPFLVSMLLVILGVLAVALLLPIFIIGGILAALAILTLIVLRMLGIPIRWNRFHARRFE